MLARVRYDALVVLPTAAVEIRGQAGRVPFLCVCVHVYECMHIKFMYVCEYLCQRVGFVCIYKYRVYT